MNNSLFYSTMRAFLVALGATFGLFIACILVMVGISLLTDSSTEELDSSFTTEIVANADGVRKALSKSAPVVLKLNIDGVIGVDGLNTKTVREQLVESRESTLKNNRVKAILLHINSPGGVAFDADNIYRALKDYKEKYKTPVYAYVDGLCASGGLYIAMAADKIYTNNTSLVGSIGVIAPSFLNFTGLLDKVGVSALTLSAGKGKDELNPLRPWKPEEGKMVQSLLDFHYQQFVNVVVSNRPLVSREKLIEEYGAEVFNPEQAQRYGFVDGTNVSLGQTIQMLVNEIGIEDDFYQVVELEKKNWLKNFLQGNSSLTQGRIVHQVQLGNEAFPSCLANHYLYLYRP